ncbi:MAG: hypothetical protein LBT38_08530 [Deltaproteobacteria bacterium]|nr:hypothetical protein [Deltaproteobacteria bacterium]
MINGDSEISRRALDNLLDNALAHGPPNSLIRVSLGSSEKGIFLEIQDQGSGVDEELLTDIFKPFFRADPARRVEGEGFGLGLSIARQAMELHGGRTMAANVRGENGQIIGFKVSLFWPNEV